MSFTGLGLTPQVKLDPWVDGKKLILPRGRSLPDLCLMCGKQAVSRSYRKTFVHYPSLAGLLLWLLFFSWFSWIGLLIGRVTAHERVRESVLLPLPLCVEHHASWRRGRRVALWLFLIGIAAIIAFGLYRGAQEQQTGVGLMVLLALVILVPPLLLPVALVLHFTQPCRDLKATYIDDSVVELVGASPSFLKTFAASSPPAVRAS